MTKTTFQAIRASVVHGWVRCLGCNGRREIKRRPRGEPAIIRCSCPNDTRQRLTVKNVEGRSWQFFRFKGGKLVKWTHTGTFDPTSERPAANAPLSASTSALRIPPPCMGKPAVETVERLRETILNMVGQAFDDHVKRHGLPATMGSWAQIDLARGNKILTLAVSPGPGPDGYLLFYHDDGSMTRMTGRNPLPAQTSGLLFLSDWLGWIPHKPRTERR